MNSLNALAESWPLRIRTSSDGVRALWRELNRFSGADASERAFKARHGDFQREHSFRNAIRLADEYYIAYADASESIDAVLLYYGSMWLSQAINFASHPSHTMDKHIKLHGIKPRIEPGAKWSFLSAKLSVMDKDATFNLTNVALGGDALDSRTFDLLDFLQALPELDDVLMQAIGKGTTALRFVELGDPDIQRRQMPSGTAMIQVEDRQSNEGYFRNNVAIFEYLSERNLKFGKGQVSWDRSRPMQQELDAISVAVGVQNFLLPRVQSLRVSEPSLFIGIIHALSELVRYHADTWLQIDERRATNTSLFVNLCTLRKREYRSSFSTI